MTIKRTSFTHRPRVSLARFSFCWWRHNRLLMTSQWPDNCDAIMWIVISNSLDIDFIHGDIHGRSCKKFLLSLVVPCNYARIIQCLLWCKPTNISQILIDIQIFSFLTIHLDMSSGKWRPFCLSLNVLILSFELSYQRCLSLVRKCPYQVRKCLLSRAYNWREIYQRSFVTLATLCNYYQITPIKCSLKDELIGWLNTMVILL